MARTCYVLVSLAAVYTSRTHASTAVAIAENYDEAEVCSADQDKMSCTRKNVAQESLGVEIAPKIFEPTHEWKTIEPNQAIPGVRVDDICHTHL